MKTFRCLFALLGLVLLGTAHAAAPQPGKGGEKYTFVVVHGATAGAWEWKKTGQFLTEDGHTVYRATLTGLGEREHLNSTDIDLQTHINDVVNLILYEDLHDVVLTGHSYGGMVITGVIDRIPERIKHVVYLDAAVPDDGMSLWDLFGGTGEAGHAAAAQRQAIHQVLQPAGVVQESRRAQAAGDLRGIHPEGQVGRGTRQDRQELAARGRARLDHPHVSRHARGDDRRSARRRHADRRVRPGPEQAGEVADEVRAPHFTW
jgi:pimeloyl-ACP methyl ester carboxylesterase